MSKKRFTKKYRTSGIKVMDILEFIPDEILEKLAGDVKVDHQVKRLHGALVFKLLLYSLLKDERLSTRIMEHYFNSSAFKAFSGKGDHETRHSSISDRINNINYEFFEKIFHFTHLKLSALQDKRQRKVKEVLRFDSTMVAVGGGLLSYGMTVGSKAKIGPGKKQLKFTIGYEGLLPISAELYTEQKYLSEDLALRESIINNSLDKNSIVTFDRGLKKRETFKEFKDEGIDFVTRVMPNIKYKFIRVHKNIKGRKCGNLILEEDIIVYLLDRNLKKIDVPFRLVKAKNISSEEPIYFLTNIFDLPAKEICEIYKRRWDIEVFFKFIKQELNFKNLCSYTENGIKVMLYMTLIAAMLILLYKNKNKIEGYKIAKMKFIEELEMELVKEIVISCGGDLKKFKKKYGT